MTGAMRRRLGPYLAKGDVGVDTRMKVRSLERTNERMRGIQGRLQNDVRHEQPKCGEGEYPCSAMAFAKVTPPASGKCREETHCGGHHGLESGRACLDCRICSTSCAGSLIAILLFIAVRCGCSEI